MSGGRDGKRDGWREGGRKEVRGTLAHFSTCFSRYSFCCFFVLSSVSLSAGNLDAALSQKYSSQKFLHNKTNSEKRRKRRREREKKRKKRGDGQILPDEIVENRFLDVHLPLLTLGE